MTLPSPTAQIFQKFMGYKPDLSTGTVNIDIPLYNLQINKFNLPLNLKYHTSGIKVNDVSYPVGYGWALMPGLRISRIIMGHADDMTTREIRRFGEIINGDYVSSYEYLKKTLKKGIDVGIDTQYDLFTLHLPTQNVTFLIEPYNNGWKATAVDSPLKIEIGSNSFKRIFNFKVTDENGFVYIFGDENVSSSFRERLPSDFIETIQSNFENEAVSSWLLKKVILPGSNNVIQFEWGRNYEVWPNVAPPAPSYSWFVQDNIKIPYQGIIETYTNREAVPQWTNGGTYKVFLEKIIAPGCFIQLDYKSREDPYLQKISVKQTENRDQPLSEYSFIYGTTAEDKPLLKELRLLDGSKYVFSYNSGFQLDDGFVRGSITRKCQDLWGYYNADFNSNGLTPKMAFEIEDSMTGTSMYINVGEGARNINENVIQAFMLNKIQYPTGGYSKFEYEVHKFKGKTLDNIFKPEYRTAQSKGGGLRVKTVKSKADEYSLEIVKRYEYGQPHADGQSDGYGIITVEPSRDTYIRENFGSYLAGHTAYTSRDRHIGCQSTVAPYLQYNTPIWYDRITEYTDNKSKTVYEYEYLPDDIFQMNGMNSMLSYTIPPLFINGYSNLFSQGPKIKSQTDYVWDYGSNNYRHVEEKDFFYENYCLRDQIYGLFNDRLVLNYTCMPNCELDFPLPNDPYEEPLFMAWYIFEEYGISLCSKKLTKELNTSYDENNNVIKTTSYEYRKHQDKIFNLSATIVSTSAHNESIKEEIYYASDQINDLTAEQREYLPDMVSQNLITTPVRFRQLKINNSVQTLLNQKTIQYHLFSNGLVLPKKIYTKILNNAEESRIEYHNYDQYGNPIYITKDGADKLLYIWGYRGQYPIAEIKNASYSEVKNALGSLAPESVSSSVTPNHLQIDNLRISNLLTNSYITTYTYLPFIGITSQKDASGLATYFDYDLYWRLKETYFKEKNSQGVEVKNILKAYGYNYKDQ